MRYWQAGFFAVVACVSFSASAQVYKCKSGGVSTYSQQPCSESATVVKTRNAPRIDVAGAAAQRAAVFKSVDMNNLGYAERDCVNNAASSALGPANQRIDGYTQQIARLNVLITQASNNVAGAAWESGLRTQIAGLEQTIATERAAATARMDQERMRCAAVRAKAAEDLDRQYNPAPKP